MKLKTHLLLLITLSLAICLGGCEKYELDRKMTKLCSKDGGVKVYEKIKLPPEMFDQWGDPFPGWRGRPLENRLGSDYRYVSETTYLKRGNPIQLFSEGVLRRYSERIIRVSDGKLIGESITYGRTGGEVILFGHPSGKRCPEIKNQSETLIRSVFLSESDL